MESPPPNWNHAIERVKLGDEAAARQMVDDLYPVVIRIVRGHLPRAEGEEDLAQEVFMKVFTKIHQYKASQPFDHWVSRIALNTCYDRLRRQRVRKELRYADLGVEDSEFFERSLSEADTGWVRPGESRAAAAELVGRLLETLKPDQRMIVRMIDLEEKSIKEVCALTGWGESRVKVAAMRARRKLSDALQSLDAEAIDQRNAAS
ncbi:MAG: RNA polymerase sigma factor [Verrucomicrobiales bacterium]